MDEAQYVLIKELEERRAILMNARKEIVQRVLLANPDVAAVDGALGEIDVMLRIAKERSNQVEETP